MATSKKYANLPDVDAAPEIYETPELIDDASTVQTGTIRSGGSPTPLDEEVHNFSAGVDRQKLDSNKARRRFEPATINARETDFSDTISGDRQDYVAGYRRRRRRGIENGALHDDSDYDVEEPAEKFARLKREAEELRSDLNARDAEESVGRHDAEVSNGMSGLDDILESIGIDAKSASKNSSLATRVQPPSDNAPQSFQGLQAEKDTQNTESDRPSTATVQAIASFADRITILEAMLGLHSRTKTGTRESTSLLPSLTTLSDQLSTLSATLLPPQTQSTTTTITPTTNPPTLTSPLPNLDALNDRIKSLTDESKRLTESRKRAKDALAELQESRLRHQRTNSRHRAHPSHNRQTSSVSQNGPNAMASGLPASANVPGADIDPDTLLINTQHTQLFLEDQASKITALYQTLPTIHDLAPTLPLVLDRLKSLSVIHAGAGEAKALMDGLEQGLLEREKEIERWRGALEGVEKGLGEMGRVMEGNGSVVEELVRGVEARVGKLEERSRAGR